MLQNVKCYQILMLESANILKVIKMWTLQNVQFYF